MPRILDFVLLAMGLGRYARAATVDNSLGVTVVVQASCLASANAKAAVSSAGTAGSTPRVSVTCTQPTPYNVSLGGKLRSPSPTETNLKSTGVGSATVVLASADAYVDAIVVTVVY